MRRMRTLGIEHCGNVVLKRGVLVDAMTGLLCDLVGEHQLIRRSE